MANDWRKYDSETKEKFKKDFLKGVFLLDNATSQQIAQTDTNEQIRVADEIKKYKELLDIGAITQDEFEIKKKQLLSKSLTVRL